ncbi:MULTISPECIES: flavodoxin [unclassified Sphingobacterium]|uniref:flavodoxin n=1 Tax=unclassified Sphingobacterium TaxID=2609468 RepID=UPI0025F29641|nr:MULTISPECIES: flavodoxin [unclassified Sphingobacterium]
MKTKVLYGFIISIFLSVTSCSRAEESGTQKGTSLIEKADSLQDRNVLIVYLSRTKNTKVLAEIIHRKVGGRLVGIELEKPYPAHYQTTVDQVAQENRTGYLPPLKTKIDSMDTYDVVFIGFPTWGMQLPPPVKSFLNDYNLAGKTVIPFNTNAGYGIGSTFDTVRQLCRGSKVLEGYSTKGGVERDGTLFVMEGDKEKSVEKEIQHWLVKIGLAK